MTEPEAIQVRHSVRQYLNKPLKPDELAELRVEVDARSKESGFHIQLVTKVPVHAGGRQGVRHTGSRLLCEDGFGHC